MNSKIVDTEIERVTSASCSINYRLKGDGWSASFNPGASNMLDIHLDPLKEVGVYRYQHIISISLNDMIELMHKIPEIVKAALPLTVLNNQGSYKTKCESVELLLIKETGERRALVLPAIEYKGEF